jgi:RNA polymerase sigma-70 factor, ECF subfamily
VSFETASAIEAIWRLESARIVGALARLVRDVGLAEELASDAFVAALEQWPNTGVPPNPGGWLMVAAKHRAIDRLRRNDTLTAKVAAVGRNLEREQVIAAFSDGLDASISATEDEINDDVLRLIFVACHPVLPVESRVALTLRVVAGLRTPEIARAYLVGEATLAQRIVRAKRTLRKHRVPFELPPRDEWTDRLASVLEAIYLIFNEGYAASEGDELVKPELCYEALRLGRALAQIMPAEPEVYGLVALMEIHAARLPARSDDAGEPIPLLEQDRGRWDQLLLRRGFIALLRAGETARPVGRYVLQAAIAACHGRARSADATDWGQIVALYDLLSLVAPSPVVELNRAVAVAMSAGPSRGLEVVDGLAGEAALEEYHLLPSVRADLLLRLGRVAEARAEFERAASMTRNERERASLLRRAEACGADQRPSEP